MVQPRDSNRAYSYMVFGFRPIKSHWWLAVIELLPYKAAENDTPFIISQSDFSNVGHDRQLDPDNE